MILREGLSGITDVEEQKEVLMNGIDINTMGHGRSLTSICTAARMRRLTRQNR